MTYGSTRTRTTLATAVMMSTLISAVGGATASAQSDAQLWTASTLRLRVSDDVRLDLTTDLRFDDDITHLASVMQSASVGVRLSRAVRVAGGYRLALNRDADANDADVWRHRLHLDLKVRQRTGPLRWSARLRWQERFERGEDTRHTARLRLKLGVDTDTAATPYASVEMFVRVAQSQALELHQWRFTVGLDLDVTRTNLDVFYRVEPRNEQGDPTVHILGLSHRFEVRR